MLPLQVCKCFVPILPPLMVCIYVQHDNAAPGGNSDIVCTAAAPPLRNFGRVCETLVVAGIFPLQGNTRKPIFLV